MEVSGVVFRPLPRLSGAGIDAHSHPSFFKPSFLVDSIDVGAARLSGEYRTLGPRDLRVSVKPTNFSGFCDDGHLQYYSSAVRCGGGGLKEKEKELSCKEKKMKKRLKLLKGMSKDISMFSDMGFGLDPDHGLADQVKGKMISEAADLLLGQLQQLKAEKKDIKRQRKEEKAKLKAARMQNRLECEGNSSSSSESSDTDCGEVVDMSRLKTESLSRSLPNESQPVIASTLAQARTIIESLQSNTPVQVGNMAEERALEVCCSQISGQKCSSTGNCTSAIKVDNLGFNGGNSLVTGESTRKIEVCMGGKCKKSGAALLLEEFQKAVGAEAGSVVGCKCMGKCRSAPNVKVLNSIDGIQAEVLDDSVRTPANPLCIGVGLEDVGTIVANFFGGSQKDLELAAASY